MPITNDIKKKKKMQVKYEHWLVIRVLKVWKASKVKYCTFSFHSPTDGSHHYHSNENATAHCHGGSKQASLTIPLIVKLFLRKASVRFHSTHIIPPGPPPSVTSASPEAASKGCRDPCPHLPVALTCEQVSVVPQPLTGHAEVKTLCRGEPSSFPPWQVLPRAPPAPEAAKPKVRWGQGASGEGCGTG